MSHIMLTPLLGDRFEFWRARSHRRRNHPHQIFPQSREANFAMV